MADAATAVSTESFPGGSGTMEIAVQAARQGAADAKDAAERAWSASGVILARAVYNTAYTVSYGLVFPVALVAQAIPRDNAAVRGLIDGANAASRAPTRFWVAQWKHRLYTENPSRAAGDRSNRASATASLPTIATLSMANGPQP